MRENADQKTSEYVYFLRSVEARVVSLANFSHDFIEKIGKVVPPKSSESASLGRDMVNNKQLYTSSSLSYYNTLEVHNFGTLPNIY